MMNLAMNFILKSCLKYDASKRHNDAIHNKNKTIDHFKPYRIYFKHFIQIQRN